jgi:hypothetical protein
MAASARTCSPSRHRREPRAPLQGDRPSQQRERIEDYMSFRPARLPRCAPSPRCRAVTVSGITSTRSRACRCSGRSSSSTGQLTETEQRSASGS